MQNRRGRSTRGKVCVGPAATESDGWRRSTSAALLLTVEQHPQVGGSGAAVKSRRLSCRALGAPELKRAELIPRYLSAYWPSPHPAARSLPAKPTKVPGTFKPRRTVDRAYSYVNTLPKLSILQNAVARARTLTN